jgi:DNA-binding transcriptional LysR family regulator
MDWDKLRIFHMVAEAGSFTHAGDVLQLSQSAISRHISALEERLGVSLFHRHARGLILTEQGELLHKASADIFARLAMIEGQLSDSKDQPEGALTITVAEFIGSLWLAPRLNLFRAAYPKIRLHFSLDDRVFNLGMREADVGIRLFKPEAPDLIQKHLATLNFVACAASSYLKKNAAPKKLEQLADHDLIAFPVIGPKPFTNPNWLYDEAGIDITNHPRIVTLNTISSQYSAVLSGTGIGLLPSFLVQDNPKLEVILPQHKPHQVEMYFVYPQERKHSRRIAIFRDFITEQIAQTKF